MDYTSTQTITEKYKVVKYAIPAIVTTHKRVVTMVRMTVVNITGILIPDSCLYPKKGWSTSSEKSGQHHKNRWSRWIGIYRLDTVDVKTKNPPSKLKWSKYKEICSTCKATGRIQEMVVDNIAKKVLFFTDARCPDCNGSEAANNKN